MIRPLTIDMIVQVSDGSFDAKLSMPVTATKQQMDALVGSWLGALKNAIDSCVKPYVEDSRDPR